MNAGAAAALGFGAGLATVVVVYVVAKPRIRPFVARAVFDQLQRTPLRAGPVDLGILPAEISRVLAAGIATGIERALP